MRAVLQRVLECTVSTQDYVSSIGRGLLIYLGIEAQDSDADIHYLADKIIHLRVFNDSEGKMNLSALETKAELMLVSQFTLCADTIKGRRPSYAKAASVETAYPLYQKFKTALNQYGLILQEGVFQAMMEVKSINHGPVTILLDSKKLF